MARTNIEIDDETCAAFMLETHTEATPDQAGLDRASAGSPVRGSRRSEAIAIERNRGGKEPMADVDSTLRNSRRFQKFRNRLIREVPRIPNDRASLAALESKGDSELLRIYMCWKLRQVATRPRRVTGQSALKADCRATSLQPNIEAFIRAVEAGADLNRYLSTKAHRHGYVLAADPEIADSRTWEDKDFLWGPGRSWRGTPSDGGMWPVCRSMKPASIPRALSTPSDGGMWPVCRRHMPLVRRRREVTGRRYLSRGQDEAASDQRSRARSRARRRGRGTR